MCQTRLVEGKAQVISYLEDDRVVLDITEGVVILAGVENRPISHVKSNDSSRSTLTGIKAIPFP